MEIFHLQYPEQMTVPSLKTYSLALGFFDGVHHGHECVIQEALRVAKEKDMTPAVMTFTPHPKRLFQKDCPERLYLTTKKEKERYLKKMGVEALFYVEFDWNLASLQPEQFIQCFIEDLNVKHVVAGFDFTFGVKGSGTMTTMEQLSAGRYTTTTVEEVAIDGETVSSTYIRHALQSGQIDLANRSLGRYYETDGIVVDGEKRGRQLGFPTANIEVHPELMLPLKGVYAVYFTVRGKRYKGVCNVGTVPTFNDGNTYTVEVHILNFDQMIYGEEVTVEWVARIRDEQKFDGIDALIAQIQADKESADAILDEVLA